MNDNFKFRLRERISDFLFGFILVPLISLLVLWVIYVASSFILLAISSQCYYLNNPLRNPFLGMILIAGIPMTVGFLAIIFLNKNKPYISLGAVLGSLLYYLILNLLFSFGIWS